MCWVYGFYHQSLMFDENTVVSPSIVHSVAFTDSMIFGAWMFFFIILFHRIKTNNVSFSTHCANVPICFPVCHVFSYEQRDGQKLGTDTFLNISMFFFFPTSQIFCHLLFISWYLNVAHNCHFIIFCNSFISQ